MTIHVYMMPESADESSGARNFEFIHASVRPRCLAKLGRRAILQQVACILGYLGISVMVPSADGQPGMACRMGEKSPCRGATSCPDMGVEVPLYGCMCHHGESRT